jgi:hypothetical protein
MTDAAATLAPPVHPTGADAFDFLHGRWAVRHRQLKQRHVGSGDWLEFEGTCYCEPRLGGMANIEEHDFVGRGGDKGIALRLYDPLTGDWSVYWASDRDGVMQPPVRGKFEGPGCILYGDDTDGGRPIVARYQWSRTDSPNPRWEQAFSLDVGKTWEINWVMDWTRVG